MRDKSDSDGRKIIRESSTVYEVYCYSYVLCTEWTEDPQLPSGPPRHDSVTRRLRWAFISEVLRTTEGSPKPAFRRAWRDDGEEI
jgi:hypothetical protein